MQLPPVLAGLVLAAALAAVMSTSSGALIATATVFSQDIVARLRDRDVEAGSEHDHVRNNRLYVAGFGIVMVLIACVLQDVVAALTVAYDILVGGLLVPILGGLVWRRGTNVGALRRWLSAPWRRWSRCWRWATSTPTSRSTWAWRRAGGVRGRQPAEQADRARDAGRVGPSQPRRGHRTRAWPPPLEALDLLRNWAFPRRASRVYDRVVHRPQENKKGKT